MTPVLRLAFAKKPSFPAGPLELPQVTNLDIHSGTDTHIRTTSADERGGDVCDLSTQTSLTQMR